MKIAADQSNEGSAVPLNKILVPVDGSAAREIPLEANVRLAMGPRVKFDYEVEDAPTFTVQQIRDAVPSPDGPLHMTWDGTDGQPGAGAALVVPMRHCADPADVTDPENCTNTESLAYEFRYAFPRSHRR